MFIYLFNLLRTDLRSEGKLKSDAQQQDFVDILWDSGNMEQSPFRKTAEFQIYLISWRYSSKAFHSGGAVACASAPE
jgi:hypothetical protein